MLDKAEPITTIRTMAIPTMTPFQSVEIKDITFIQYNYEK
jgi:hypothetical protein